ncbi:hypothetical protein KZ813_04445 [Sphingomonas sp. RHCKR7]|uniref:hypothetical protein n=1 Tax=Sphingomonas folli TaxID=2862497 RepID=UPI001CA542B2|nr:hypothetical protein [Sphingomonas folli]MBW6526080.1 hypothetical protein [Sphingomonas folli]
MSPQTRPGELSSQGVVDKWAGLGLVAAGVLFVVFTSIGGIVRGVLGPIAAPLIYLPALIAIPALLANTLVRVGDPRTSTPTIAVLVFLAIEIVIAKLLGRATSAIAYQLYVFLAGLVMMAATQRGMHERIIAAMVPMFYVSVIGVLLNVFIDFPWKDASFEVMGTQQGAAREWTAGGVKRLAGFSRASYFAAACILIGYCAAEARLKTFAMKALFWVLGLVAIHLTTSKAPELAMILLPGTYFLLGRLKGTGAPRRKLIANIHMAFWIALIFAGPLMAVSYGRQLFPRGPGVGPSYSSLADRVLTTWPDALALVNWRDPISWVVGRGLGGIGGPQTIAEVDRYNPADNLAIYLFVIFGLGAVLIAFFIFRGGQRAIQSDRSGRRDFAMIIAMLGIGAASNVVESVFAMMVLGLAIARQPPRTAKQVRRRRAHRGRSDEMASAQAGI